MTERLIPPQAGAFAPLPDALSPAMRAKLEVLGITRLYAHQATAIQAALEGRDVVLATGTSSGKTLAYALPMFERLRREPFARAIITYPTKALAQDQLRRLRELAGSEFRIETYDGDTSQAKRTEIRRAANVILTNPDMLHVSVLPRHPQWASFLRSTRLLVMDEVHAYRGVFGSHVAHVMRRLLRLCEGYRSRPQVFAGSATIGNPRELFLAMTGRDPVVIDDDASPQGERRICFTVPAELAPGQHASANVLVSETLVELVSKGVKTLAFSRARTSSELVLRHARGISPQADVPPAKLESYRAGYTPKERRQIEGDLFKGRLMGLSATSAMELGVDVGALDAVVMNGYPGSLSSFWQQAGRAGRGGRGGLVVMVGRDDPLDQYLMRHPEALLDARRERILIRPENPRILRAHLRCAAYEAPIRVSELPLFPDGALDEVERLEREGELTFREGAFGLATPASPALDVNIRATGGKSVSLQANGAEIGTMEYWRALNQAHAGAIYLHRGATFLIERLDLESLVATLRPTDSPYYTETMVEGTLFETARRSGDGRMGCVDVTVAEQVVGYRRKAFDGSEASEVIALDLPGISYETTAVRLELPLPPSDVDPAAGMGGLHGAEHALLAVAPLFAGCDRGDLGSSWFAAAPPDNRPCVYVYDRIPGGVGLADGLFADRHAWVQAALKLVLECPCREGCPACLLMPRCPTANEPLDKPQTAGALTWLEHRLRPA